MPPRPPLFAALLLVLSVARAACAAEPSEAGLISRDEARAAAAAMLADARARTGRALDGSAGRDGAFDVEADGARLTPGGLLLFRYTHSDTQDDGDERGFAGVRTRFWLKGDVYDGLTFFVRAQFSGVGRRRTASGEEEVVRGRATLNRAWVGARLAEGVSVRWGQQVSDLTREGQHPPELQLGVAASPTDSVFGVGAFTGVELRTTSEDVRTFTILSNGARVTGTEIDSPRNADAAVTFKVDYRLAGAWRRFRDFTSFPGSDAAAMVGAGVHWETGGERTPGREARQLLGVAEASLEGDGWNAYASFYWSHNRIGAPNFVNDLGALVQGGVFVSDRTELFARFDAVLADNDREARSGDFRTLTAGLNVYPIAGSTAAKFSLDAVYFLDDQAGSLVRPNANTGVRASGEDGQYALRAQFALRW